MGVDPSKTPDDMECIRCGDCVKNCPTKALSAGFLTGKRKIDSDSCEKDAEQSEAQNDQ
jgi:ferredoxin